MRLLECSSASLVQRWERGESDPPNMMVVAYKKLSMGDVTSEDFARVRKRYLSQQASATEAV